MIIRPNSDRSSVVDAYSMVRRTTEELCRPLQTEDYVIQPVDDVSPPKWHLAHVTWFFETFLLSRFLESYKPFHPQFGFLFNSYYETIGQRWARAQRGLLSRPTVAEVYQYRAFVDGRMRELIQSVDEKNWKEVFFLVDLGLNHEQQHQELLVTDMKSILAINPLKPVYIPRKQTGSLMETPQSKFISIDGGVVDVGFAGTEFSFDSERPRHREYLNPYLLQNRLVTNGEYLEFMRDGGYKDFRHWLSEGWGLVNEKQWNAPLYWEERDGEWQVMTLSGILPIDLSEPVCHVSYFEADAFAHWSGKRLPTEAEWEHAATDLDISKGNYLDSRQFHPIPIQQEQRFMQMYGDVWEWTSSAYLPYPGFQPEPGAVGEYNGKFMSNQMVLRGGSCATPANHMRLSYRNFFQCDKRWQFTGIRLAANSGG